MFWRLLKWIWADEAPVPAPVVFVPPQPGDPRVAVVTHSN